MSTDTRIDTDPTDLEELPEETTAASEEAAAEGAAAEGAAAVGPADEAPETTAAGPGPSVATRRGRWRLVGAAALILVAVAALAAAAVLGWKLKETKDIQAAADQARATARNYAVTLTSVNSDGLDQNFTRVLDGATGEFKDMYAKSSEQLKQLLIDNHATAQGTVIEDGIKSATKTKVEVLLFVDQAVTNTVTPDPRMDRSRVVMTMELVDGRWLASKVDLP